LNTVSSKIERGLKLRRQNNWNSALGFLWFLTDETSTGLPSGGGVSRTEGSPERKTVRKPRQKDASINLVMLTYAYIV